MSWAVTKKIMTQNKTMKQNKTKKIKIIDKKYDSLFVEAGLFMVSKLMVPVDPILQQYLFIMRNLLGRIFVKMLINIYLVIILFMSLS